MKPGLQHVLRTFLTGALALLPLAATLFILAWTLRFLSGWLGPESAFGRLLTFIGLSVTTSEAVATGSAAVLQLALYWAAFRLVFALKLTFPFGMLPRMALNLAVPVALALLRAFDGGLAAPSANRFGRISPTTAAHVHEELGERVAMILDGGACAVGIESTILDFSRDVPEILRPGAITPEDIARVIGRRPRVPGESVAETASARAGQCGDASGLAEAAAPNAAADAAQPAPRVSGALAAHYAPRTPLRLVEPALLADEAAALAGEGSRVAVLAHSTSDPRDARLSWRSLPADPAAYAQGLYASLRALDGVGADFILIEALPGGPGWRAVADRLGRAAVGSGATD